MSQDSQLQQAVLAELKWEPSITAAHIGVTAKSGIVALTGHVDSYMEKHAAEMAASRVKGVKAVAEEIEVRLPFDQRRTDENIAAAAINRMDWDVAVPEAGVEVKVENGWLTLTGLVDWHYQRQAAERDVRNLMGVVGVSNQIGIKPKVDAANLSDDILHALNRSWFFDPKTITVTAQGGKVKLTGTVRSWHDREVAEKTAWAAPGVTSVENKIMIDHLIQGGSHSTAVAIA